MPSNPTLTQLISDIAALETLPCAPEAVVVDDGIFLGVDGTNVLVIQTVIGLLNRSPSVKLAWSLASLKVFQTSPSAFPLLACLVFHSNTLHTLETGQPFPLKAIRNKIHQTRLRFDWFSAPQSLLCADHLGLGRQKELYQSPIASGIRPREHFETLVFPYIESQLAISVTEGKAFKWGAALTSIIFELFENTDLHGKTDWSGKVIQNSIRGLVFKDSLINPYQSTGSSKKPMRCLEIGVFDAGVGYFCKSRKMPLTKDVTLEDEWRTLHLCLSTHLEDGLTPNFDKGQRGIGLYEVLRALKFLEGAIEFRTGRLHAYRSFLPGDLRVQMEPKESVRPNMPKPKLLDLSRKFLAIPTEHAASAGSAVRVLIPVF